MAASQFYACLMFLKESPPARWCEEVKQLLKMFKQGHLASLFIIPVWYNSLRTRRTTSSKSADGKVQELHRKMADPIDDMGSSEYSGHPCYEAFQLEAYIGVPLLVDGQRFGTLNFSSSKYIFFYNHI